MRQHRRKILRKQYLLKSNSLFVRDPDRRKDALDLASARQHFLRWKVTLKTHKLRRKYKA
jgi:hypothetical protein